MTDGALLANRSTPWSTHLPETLRSDLDEVLASTEDLWRSLAGGRLFLTGATGFFGMWLLSSLAHARARLGVKLEATVLVRDPSRARAQHGDLLDAAGVSLAAGDVRRFVFPEGSFSHVIHGATAASASLNENAPREMFDVIVQGTSRVVDFAHDCGAGRFLFLSSGAVYGKQEVTHVPEESRVGPPVLDPQSAYAEGKRAAEQLASISATRFELTVARGFAFVAPYLPLDIHFAMGNFIRDALAGGPIRLSGDGTPFRSYLYGTDLVTWLLTMLVRGRHRTAYNLGSDDGRPLADIAREVAKVAGVSVEIAKTAPPGHVPGRYVPDVTLARTELGLDIRVDLEEAIRRTLAFHGWRPTRVDSRP